MAEEVAGTLNRVFNTDAPAHLYLDTKDDKLVSKDGHTRLASADIMRRAQGSLADSVRAWWAGREDGSSVTRLEQLRSVRENQLRLQVQLAVAEGRLSKAEGMLAERALNHPTLADRQKAFPHGARPGVFAVHEKKEGENAPGTRLAGAFIITARDGTGEFRPSQGNAVPLDPVYTGSPAILYTPDRGFERFDDVWKLHDALASRMTSGPASTSPVRYLPLEAQRSTPGRNWTNNLWRSYQPINRHLVHDNVQSLQDKAAQDMAYAARPATGKVTNLDSLASRADEAVDLAQRLYIASLPDASADVTQGMKALGKAVPRPLQVAEKLVNSWLHTTYLAVERRGLSAPDLTVRVTHADGSHEDLSLMELFLRRASTQKAIPPYSPVTGMQLLGPLGPAELPTDSTAELQQLLDGMSPERFKAEVEKAWSAFWQNPADFSPGETVRTFQGIQAGVFLRAEAEHRRRSGALSDEVYRAVTNQLATPLPGVPARQPSMWDLVHADGQKKGKHVPGLLVITQDHDVKSDVTSGAVALWHRGAPLREYDNLAEMKKALKAEGFGELQARHRPGAPSRAGMWWSHDMREELANHLNKVLRDLPPKEAEAFLQQLDGDFNDIVTAYTAPPAQQPVGQAEREQRMRDYAANVKGLLADTETGSEAERNVKFIRARPLMTPVGYFRGGLSAAGYDPDEKFTVTYKTYVHSPTGKATLHSESSHTYAAWEIAAGMSVHDQSPSGGVVNTVDTEYASSEAK
ncbi:hypothetical protein J7E41_27710, partial [Pseudomonas fluorescens]|nr:hypothetical protein [Pseudomonas fluorescens]